MCLSYIMDRTVLAACRSDINGCFGVCSVVLYYGGSTAVKKEPYYE